MQLDDQAMRQQEVLYDVEFALQVRLHWCRVHSFL